MLGISVLGAQTLGAEPNTGLSAVQSMPAFGQVATAIGAWQAEGVQTIPDFAQTATGHAVPVPDFAIEIIKFAREDRTFYKPALSPIVIAAQARYVLIPAIDNRTVIYNEGRTIAFDKEETNRVPPEDRLAIIRRAA